MAKRRGIETSAAASALGSIGSDEKKRAAKERAARCGTPVSPGRTPVPLSALLCTCPVGDGEELHRSYCPRGQAQRRRARKAQEGQP